MASGRLGVADVAATTNTLVYTVPAGVTATVNINVVNRNTSAAVVRVAIVDGNVGALAVEDYIEYETSLAAHGILERSGVVMSAGESVVVYSTLANVSIRVYGFEGA